MGVSFSKNMTVDDLAVFKKLPSNTLLDNIQIPERSENRVPTDRKFLIIFVVVVILLIPCLIYTLVNSGFSRFKGYDQCGNVCGKKNTKYSEWSCTGADFTNKPYLQYETSTGKTTWDEYLLTPRECVEKCSSGYVQVMNSCYLIERKSNPFNDLRFKRNGISDEDKKDIRIKRSSDESVENVGNDIGAYLKKHAWRIVLSCALSLVVALGMLILFKTATAAVVWGILGGVLLFGAVITGIAWYGYFSLNKLTNNENAQNIKQAILIFAIFLTVMLLILFCVMVFMYKKILLVIQLLKEATKAAFAMPLLIFTPIITFIAEVIVIVLLILTTAFMLTSGVLKEEQPNYLEYKQNFVMSFTLIFNVIVAFWSTQLIVGIQYMVIAGAVATWYWAKNKNNMVSPISNSARIVFRFHLGSIAFGSLVITIIAIIRALLTSLTKNRSVKALIDFCIGTLERFLKFLSKNAYILTAMHGKPFFKSGKRAAKIIWQNAVNIASVNYVGDFVLGMAQLLIVIISLLITVGIMQGAEGNYSAVVYIIVFFVSLFLAVTFFSIFETTIDTIFICFCEDSLMNDGMARPYAMSRDLMEFVENSKKIYGEKKD